MVHYDSYLLTYLSKGLARAVSPATRKQIESLIKSIEDVKEERVKETCMVKRFPLCLSFTWIK